MKKKKYIPSSHSVGQRFGRLLVLSLRMDKGRAWVTVRCDCGTEKEVDLHTLRNGKSKSCGCLKLGQEGQSTLHEYKVWNHMINGGYALVCDRWLKFNNFYSDMGPRPFEHSRLKRINTERGYSPDNCVWGGHGESGRAGNTPEYTAWLSMLRRCYDPKQDHYKDYGGRGIQVYSEWRQSYAKFLAHVGRKPSPQHSLGRLDNNGNYEPRNVAWQTKEEQQNNTRRNVNLEHRGRTRTVAQWGCELGFDPKLIHERLRRGWSISKTLTTPEAKYICPHCKMTVGHGELKRA